MNPFKKLCLILLLILTAAAAMNGQVMTNKAAGKILFSIGTGEYPLFNGSFIELSPIGTRVTVITTDNADRIFVYENGKRKGPFKEITEIKVTLPEDNPEEYDPVLRRESDTDYEKYLQYSDTGEITLKFGGRSFGPFQFILEFFSTSDKSAFSAVVMKGGKPQIITSSGNRYDPDGQPIYTCASASGKSMMVTVVKENNPDKQPITGAISGLSTDESAKPEKKTEVKQLRPPEAFIWFQDGKKFGPYDPRKINANNPAFDKTGGENWLLTIDSKLYINGAFVRDLINEHISPANIWLTEDGKRYVIIGYNRIEFSDGSTFINPLKIRISVEGKKITVWWLLLENERDVVFYSKTI